MLIEEVKHLLREFIAIEDIDEDDIDYYADRITELFDINIEIGEDFKDYDNWID